MFNVNDNVMYGTTGVCRIDEIRSENSLGGGSIEYYILHPVYENNIKIMIPVHTTVMMRKIVSKETVSSLIQDMASRQTIWIDDNKERNAVYKTALQTGDCSEWIRLIKTLTIKQKEKTALGKRLLRADETILKSAEKMLHEEFAASLNIPVHEVLPYIMDRI